MHVDDYQKQDANKLLAHEKVAIMEAMQAQAAKPEAPAASPIAVSPVLGNQFGNRARRNSHDNNYHNMQSPRNVPSPRSMPIAPSPSAPILAPILPRPPSTPPPLGPVPPPGPPPAPPPVPPPVSPASTPGQNASRSTAQQLLLTLQNLLPHMNVKSLVSDPNALKNFLNQNPEIHGRLCSQLAKAKTGHS